MLEFIREWVLGIVMLLMFIVLLEMLLPSGRIKKYANLVTGFILIIAIVNPPLKYFGSNTLPAEMIDWESNYIDREVIQLDSKLLEEEQTRQIVELYRKKLIQQLEYTALDVEGVGSVTADVIINEDYESETFGEIKRAYLAVTEKEKDGRDKKIKKVEKVSVGGNDAVLSKTEERLDAELEEKLREKVGSLFGIHGDAIVISAQEV